MRVMRMGAQGPRLRASAQVTLAWTLAVHVVIVGGACRRSSGGSSAATAAGQVSSADSSQRAAPTGPVRVPQPLRPGYAEVVVDAARLEKLAARNLAVSVSLPESLLADRIAAWRQIPTGDRIARWALLFASRSDNAYCFGPKPGGYVAESLLVQDYKFDCVLLFYRCTELARATSPRRAVFAALETRFADGDPERVVSPAGGVDYDAPSHLDYSEDFAATGLWGRDVTREVGDAVQESAGTSRYPAGTRWFIPEERIRYDRLRNGDLLFFVLDERNPGARKLRDDYGLLVGHQGIVHVDGGEVRVVHAAASGLEGLYSGNRVVEVPLRTYLERLERFKGIFVSRIEDVPTDAGAR